MTCTIGQVEYVEFLQLAAPLAIQTSPVFKQSNNFHGITGSKQHAMFEYQNKDTHKTLVDLESEKKTLVQSSVQWD